MNGIIDPEQRYGSLERGLQAANFADRWLEHTRRHIIPHLPVQQIQAIPKEDLLLISCRCILCCIVVCPKLGDEVSRILCGVYGEGLGNDKKRASKLCDGQLFPRALGTRKN